MSHVIQNTITWNEQQADYHVKEAAKLGGKGKDFEAIEHERHAVRQYANAEALKAQL